METFNPGDQIKYVPTHAEDDINHPDCQWGFVVNENPRMKGTYFCRYYIKATNNLRTKANSEGTDAHLLRRITHKPQSMIKRHWEQYVTPVTGQPYPDEKNE